VVFRRFAIWGGVLFLLCSCADKKEVSEPRSGPDPTASKDAGSSHTEVFQRERMKPSQVDEAITKKEVENPTDGVVYRGPGRNAIGQASQAYQAQDFERAREILARLLEVEPGQPVARAMAGEIAETTGAFEDAREHFRRSLEGLADFPQNRDRMNLQYQIGALLYHAGLSFDAIGPLQESLKHPAAVGHEGRLNLMLALALEQTGYLEKAQATMKLATVADRDEKVRSRSLARMNDLSKKSRRVLEKAWDLYRNGEYDQAREGIDGIKSTGPHRRLLAALLDLESGDYAAAQKALSGLLFEVSEWRSVYRSLRNSQVSLPSQHLQYMDVVRSIQNGRKHTKTGRYDLFYGELLAALNMYPWVPLAYNKLSVVAHTLKKMGLAERYREIQRSMRQVMMSFKGDGRSLERAFQVLHIGEEEAFMNALGYNRTNRTVVYGKDGTPFHRIEAEKPGANRSRTFYFNAARIEPARGSGR